MFRLGYESAKARCNDGSLFHATLGKTDGPLRAAAVTWKNSSRGINCGSRQRPECCRRRVSMLPRPTIRHSALKTRLLGILIATLGAWTSPASAEDCKVLEDFSSSAPNEFPKDWTPRDKSGSAVYTVRKEDSRAFVRAHAEGPKAKGNGIEADRPVIWDIEKYPVLRWRWRARVFPTGADEHKGRENGAFGISVGFCPPQDQAFCERSVKGQLGFTDTLSMTKALFSKGIGSLKYIWSERLPKGFEFERSRKTV